jgi:hypothetical protein
VNFSHWGSRTSFYRRLLMTSHRWATLSTVSFDKSL